MTARPGERVRVLFDEHEIERAVADLAAAIARDLAGRSVFVVPVMNAALLFATDLLRALPASLDVLGFGVACAASYGDALEARSAPRITAFPPADRVAGRTVLVVDAVLDTGATASAVIARARAEGAADVRFACLVDKPARRRHPVPVSWRAFTAPDVVVVGYGIDAAGRYRTLPYVGALEIE